MTDRPHNSRRTRFFRHLRRSGSTSRRSFRPVAERLDDRLVLSTLPTTTVAGASVGQTLGNVVNTPSLGGLTVESTAGFSTASPSNFLLLSNGSTPFASINFSNTTATAFTTLAMPAGDPTVQLSSTTVVAQAASGQTAAGAGQSLSSTPFTLNMTGSASAFTPSGYLYVQGSNGNYIIHYTSVTAISGGNSQFQGCTIVGSFGQLKTSPFSDVVNAGAFIVQTVAPTAGSTTSINTSEINVQASVPGDSTQSYPFTLTVLSANGFATPSPNLPKYMLVYFSNGTMSVVSYTGITPNPQGGYDITGCLSPTAGTIGAFGQTTGPTANVQWTSASPIDFQFTNNSGQTPVYVAIAGQQIDPISGISTYGFLSPALAGGASTDLWTFQAFTSQASVPSSMIFSTTDPAGAKKSLLIPNDPYKRLDSIRMIFSVGSAPTIPVVAGKPNFPAAGNPSDPNDSITYDFVEFTERSSPNDGILFINTTQVDQVGIPFLMQATPPDSVKSNGVGITVSRSELYYQFDQYISNQFASLTGTTAANAAQAFSSLKTPNRLLNPSDAISNPPNPALTGSLETYFDAALTQFFTNYQQPGQTFQFQRDGYFFSGQTVTGYTPAPYSASATNTGSGLLIPPNGNAPTSLVFAIGQSVSGPGIPSGAKITNFSVDGSNTTTVSYSPAGTAQSGPANYTFSLPSGYTVLQLKQTDSNWNVLSGGQQYQIYAPYFSNGSSYPANFPASTATPPIAPPWVAPSVAQSAGLMVFGNLGTFSDGAMQAATGQISGNGASGQILLDIQNSIVSAFNRGIANAVAPGNDVTAAWNDNTTFYPAPNQGGTNWSNFYAGFLHNDGVSITAPGSNVGLAYGFAYDDQGGNDPTLVSYASTIAITLQPWTSATSLAITPSVLNTSVGQPTQITVTAYKDQSRSIVDTTYVGEIVFDAQEVALGLPATYQFRPEDQGRKTFFFTPKSAGAFATEVSDPANRLASTLQVQVDPGRIEFGVGTDSGSPSVVKLFDADGFEVLELTPFAPSFRGGVRVAVGDVDGDGYADVAVVSGAGITTELKVYDGRDGSLKISQKPFGEGYSGGAYVVAGDFDRDGRQEFVVSAASGSSTFLIVDGLSGQPLVRRNAFHAGYRGGITVAASDLNHDGFDEVIAGATGGNGQVRVFDGRTMRVLSTFHAFGPGYRGPIALAGGDMLGDSKGEIIVGTSSLDPLNRPNANFRVFDGHGRLLTSLRTRVAGGFGALSIGASPDANRPGKQLVLVNGGPGDAAVDSYRIVNVSPYPGRPSYRAIDAGTVFPFGAGNSGGFNLGGRPSNSLVTSLANRASSRASRTLNR